MQIDNLAISKKVKYSVFSSLCGASEYYFTISASEGSSFEAGLLDIAELYQEALYELGLDSSTQQFVRVYFSDIANEFTKFEHSKLYTILNRGALSVVEQSPLDSVPVSILAYHIKSDCGSFESKSTNKIVAGQQRQEIINTGKNYSLLWTSNYAGSGQLDSYDQTNEVFDSLSSSLESHKMTLRHNTVRTWIYVRDIDNNYSGMVRARRELFNRIGLTTKSRYIASTGIEGSAVKSSSLLTVDALSIGNIRQEQIIRIEAPQYLSSTSVYGVTFERGIRLRFGDRSHFHISGTASIDSEGHLVHRGDVIKQTERTFKNIQALLESQGACMEDMRYYIIYLRNPKQYSVVKDVLSGTIPDSTPVIAVQGSVCRPGWLVEIEGVGIKDDSTDLPDFL